MGWECFGGGGEGVGLQVSVCLSVGMDGCVGLCVGGDGFFVYVGVFLCGCF